jgi:hypothetical protein
MSNSVFANKVIAAKATDLLMTSLNHRNLMTIDTDLQGSEGMTKTINTYTYSGEAEVLAAGNGSTAAKRGAVSYVGKDYTVQCIQQAFDYLDEDFMKDSKVVDIATQGATQVMVNFLTDKFYAALATTSSGAELVGKTEFAKGSAISYDVIVDAIADMGIEDESKLVLVIPNEWKADLRKDDDYKSARMGEVVYNGQVGQIAGIPVVATKRLDHTGSGANLVPAKAYLLTPEAITLFVKKNVEVEQDRNSDTRSNAVYLREYYVCALTDATKARKIVEAAA